jgi:hypothetical protein
MLATVLMVLEKLGETSRKAQERPDTTKPKKLNPTFMKINAASGDVINPEMIKEPPTCRK